VRLLFLAALRKTLHEVTIGLDLARQLPASSHFVVDAGNAGQVTAAGFGCTVIDPALGAGVRDEVARVVAEVRPDAIVLADFLGHWLTMRTSYGTDPWFVSDFGIPVVPIDLYELADGTRSVEVLGRTTDVGDEVLGMHPHLRPVPMARPVRTGSARPYRAAPALAPLTAARRAEVRRGLGVADGDRLLVVPTLPWQRLMREHAGPATRELAARLPALVAQYLRQLAGTHVLVTGPVFDGPPAPRATVRESYTAAEYDAMIGAADLVWSFHLPSFGIERALPMDVPGVLSVNRTPVPRGTVPDGAAPAVRDWLAGYPLDLPEFHMWPLRWNALLAPLLAGNPYAGCVPVTELLDAGAVLGTLHALLHDPATRASAAEARARYAGLVAALPSPAEALDEALAAH
jgi:hypothetical protein